MTTECPFCGFKTEGEYKILLHLEEHHAEGKSPFVADEPSTANEPPAAGRGHHAADPDFVECPIDGCGEAVALAELDDHLELHASEEYQEQVEISPCSAQDFTGSHGDHIRPSGFLDHVTNKEHTYPASLTAQNHHALARARWRELLHMPSSSADQSTGEPQMRVRLGKAELGKYAHEDQMPEWLVSLLKRGGYVCSKGMVPIIKQLLQQSHTSKSAYLCHQSVQHISKLRREGGFCGYRNIQMLASYLTGTGDTGRAHFKGEIPSIFRIQDIIENAWDMGFNPQGRVETGGIKGTRKYIGTPEAQAMFQSLQIPCSAEGFKDARPGVAESLLLESVRKYFKSASSIDKQGRVRCTNRPPIYFQHRGHSLTIVGIEKRTDGSRELLVFDPMFQDSISLTKYIDRVFKHKSPDVALKLYRRGSKYLRKYSEFELLR